MPDTGTNELDPTVFVLYGATGDLARRMVLPAFFELAQHGLLPDDWRLIGSGRGERSDEEFVEHVHDALEEFGPQPRRGPLGRLRQAAALRRRRLHRRRPGPAARRRHDRARGAGGRRPARALPLPAAQGVHRLHPGAGRPRSRQGRPAWSTRSPSAASPEGFRELDDLVHSVFAEDQVFRIDHFLGKEGTQDLHALRFANGLFEPMWSREHVAQVQIDVPEDLDVADRADFYDATGATLDMLVTHLFQVAAEVAMEPPVSFSANDILSARESVLAKFRPLAPEDVVLGQFEGYRELDGVPDDSTTDTYVAARLFIDSGRWRGVPFLLRTGKRLAAKQQRVSLILHRPKGPVDDVPANGNVVSLSLAGAGAVDIDVMAKKPGPDLAMAPARVSLDLSKVPGGEPLAPYVSLIHDVLVGDRSLFTTSEGLAQTWRALQPVLDHRPEVHPYAPDSWGPAAANALTGEHGWLLGQTED